MTAGDKWDRFSLKYCSCGVYGRSVPSNLLGTRTYEMNTLRGIAGRSLTYNAEDQLLNVGTASYQYNADGFLSKKTDGADVTTYDYSSNGELLSAVLPNAQNIEYVYDPVGRRIAKKVNGTIVEKYLWSGLTTLLAVYDGSNSLLMRFEYSDGRMPNVMTKGGATYYLTYDQVGSLRAVYDATGAIVKRMDYDSFGNIIVDTNSAFTVPFGFAGGLDDKDIGLVHFGFRDYDPSTGRWTAKDPIGFAGGDVDLYGYVLSNPINYVDPDGKFAIVDDLAFWTIVGIGIGSYIALEYYYQHIPSIAERICRINPWKDTTAITETPWVPENIPKPGSTPPSDPWGKFWWIIWKAVTLGNIFNK